MREVWVSDVKLKRFQVVQTHPDNLIPGTKVCLSTDVDALEEKRKKLRAALEAVVAIEPGSRGAYMKFQRAKQIAEYAIAEDSKP